MAFGNNTILPFKKGGGNSIDIQEIFFTFQGEGIFTGFPAIFVRLGGCNLACKFCDTEFDSYQEMNLEDIMSKTQELSQRKCNLVVVTGGEPLRQNIVPLCQKLIKDNFEVQIETNGTLFQDLPKEVSIICSPKNNSEKYYPIRQDLLSRISAFKFIISATNKNYSFVPEVGQSKYNIPVYLQPMDEYDNVKNQNNYQLTLKLARESGCRISLQTQKFWKIK